MKKESKGKGKAKQILKRKNFKHKQTNKAYTLTCAWTHIMQNKIKQSDLIGETHPKRKSLFCCLNQILSPKKSID